MSPMTTGNSGDRFNFAAFLFEENRGRAQKTAYVDDRRTQSYGELEEAARRFATVLTARGVRREERIVLFMLDSVELPIAFLGALFAGVVPVLVNTMLPSGDVAYMIEHSNARLVVASEELAPTYQPALGSLRAFDHEPMLIVAGEPSTPDGFHSVLAASSPAPQPARTYADDIALWLYSSGSTGRPKAVAHTHDNIRQTVELYGKPIFGVTEHDTVFSAAKLFFAYGLGNGLSFPLAVGARVLLMAGRPTPEAIFRRLIEQRVTIFCGAPTTYVAMLASASLPSRDTLSLRHAISAGEALPEAVGARFEAHFGAPILDGIGSTEMLHIYLSNRLGDVRYGTSGRPVPGYEVEIRDENGHPVPMGELGDLWVSGPSAALMYWRDRKRTQATFFGPWMKTGDKYRTLPSGHLEYAGRSDDMLKVSGQYVSPIEVEAALQTHDAVFEAAVVGKIDEQGLMRTVAYVVVRGAPAGGDSLAQELKAHVKARLSPHKYPREVHFVDELPKTATGKVQRYRLR